MAYLKITGTHLPKMKWRRTPNFNETQIKSEAPFWLMKMPLMQLFDVTVQVQMFAIFTETGVTILPETGMTM